MLGGTIIISDMSIYRSEHVHIEHGPLPAYPPRPLAVGAAVAAGLGTTATLLVPPLLDAMLALQAQHRQLAVLAPDGDCVAISLSNLFIHDACVVRNTETESKSTSVVQKENVFTVFRVRKGQKTTRFQADKKKITTTGCSSAIFTPSAVPCDT